MNFIAYEMKKRKKERSGFVPLIIDVHGWNIARIQCENYVVRLRSLMAAYLLLSIVYYNELIPENLFAEDGNIRISFFKNFSKNLLLLFYTTAFQKHPY